MLHDPIERMKDAAARLGMSIHTMRARARRIELPLPPRGRPECGTVKGLPSSEWDKVLTARPRCGRLPREYDDARPDAPWDVAEDRILWRYTVGRDPRKSGIDWNRILHLLPRRDRAGAGRRLTDLRGAGLRPMRPRDHDTVVKHYAMMQCDDATVRFLRHRPEYIDRYASFYRIGPPSGRLTLPVAAERAGFERRTLLAILARQGVEVLATRRLSDGCLLYSHVDEAACNAAVLRDMAMETVAQASVRCQTSYSAMREWMIEAGHMPSGRSGRITKYPSEVFDAVVAAKRAADSERVAVVSRRTGVARSTLRDRLRREAGDTKRPMPSGIVDRVVNTRRAQCVGAV